MNKVMVFAPHPDDDILGCGGSIAKYVRQGCEFITVYMTSGEAGSLTSPCNELAIQRENEARQASSFLGVKETVFLRNPDGFLEYSRNNLINIINLIRKTKPDTIYVPHHLDGNEDHRITCKLVLDACRRASGPWFQECRNVPWEVETVLAYEIWTPLQEVSWQEDITEYMDQKIDALHMHQSQLKDIRYDEAIKGLNHYRGIMSGKGKYCECFQILKAVL
ncbi:MAG TPA: PIG-L deacetylase family protein [Syntrophomonadaceae bacterium]|nr:PIG-L deacetylase family protein [Syntrophomonadaceae bacterium]